MKMQGFLLSLGALLILGSASAAAVSPRYPQALDIATVGNMTERVIPAGMFNLTTWERITRPGQPISIYIEGDGLTHLPNGQISPDPAPPYPMPLRISTADPAANVIYIARPCMYTGTTTGKPCTSFYWLSGRTAPEVIDLFGIALDNIKELYQASGFNLIGYSGGAAVAALVAARRPDILSFRTIGGSLDYKALITMHHAPPIEGSLDPIDVAPQLAHIPQQHFHGARDNVIPPEIFESWKHASGETTCIRYTVNPTASHENGWVETWPELLKAPLDCTP